MNLPNAVITVESVGIDGRPIKVTTQGTAEIRLKKPWASDDIPLRESLSLTPRQDYELVADLVYDFKTDSVYRLEMQDIFVTKTLRTAYDGWTNIERLKDVLDVPEQATAVFPEGVAEVVFEWSEKV